MSLPSRPTQGFKLWRQLAAPHWTSFFFILLAACAFAIDREGERTPTILMAAPFILLALNLGAAIIFKPRFRRDLVLLFFHLCLLFFVFYLLWARLSYLNATFALTQGDRFDGALISQEKGPLHRERLEDVQFVNLGFAEQRSANGRYFSKTQNRIRWRSPRGLWQEGTIGDDHPLVMAGYRIYTNRNRGYSPIFKWQGEQGAVEYGSVQLSSVERGAFAASNQWTLANGLAVWAMLEIPPAQMKNRLNMNVASLEHSLILRINDQRHELQPGEGIDLKGGRLTYVKLKPWMGYKLVYDPTLKALVAVIILALLSLCFFYLRQPIFRGSWDRD